jgi:ATP-dependent Clp protease ATP-binding subunit ClpA
MFERFTDRARQLVKGAQEEARLLGHPYIGTEHLLLAILSLDGGIAHDILVGQGLSAEGVRQAVQTEVHNDPYTDAEALESIGIDLNAVKAKLEEAFGPGALDEPPPRRKGWFGRKAPRRSPGHIPFTSRAKVVLELSLREAIALKHKHIGTEHILLGLIREGQGLAAKILADQGLDLKQLRAKTIEASNKSSGG